MCVSLEVCSWSHLGHWYLTICWKFVANLQSLLQIICHCVTHRIWNSRFSYPQQNVERQGHPVRPSQLSPPSRETRSSTRPALHHATHNGVEDLILPTRSLAFNSTYSSVPQPRQPVFTSTTASQAPSHAAPVSSGSLMFDDSLEVLSSSNNQSETRPASSLGLRNSVTNNSGVLSFF